MVELGCEISKAPELEPTIYHTGGKHANFYTIYVVANLVDY
jgi:hypothetical protein